MINGLFTNSAALSNQEQWIDMLNPISVARWTSRLQVSEKELLNIVQIAGGNAKSVQEYLASRKAFIPSGLGGN